MNNAKINKVIQELEKLTTISQRLDFYKENYLDRYPGDLLFEYFEAKTAEELESDSPDGFEGDIRIPFSGETGQYLIPLLLRSNYATPTSACIEYDCWLLFYKAERLFEEQHKPKYDCERFNPIGQMTIKGKIAEIKRIQRNAKKLLTNGRIQISRFDDLTAEKLYLWYKKKFYMENDFWQGWRGNFDEYVKSICYHKFLLPFLTRIEKLGSKDKREKNKAFRLEKIDVKPLLSELLIKEYYDISDKERFEEWFIGVPINNIINIKKPMSYFVTIIATLKDKGHIKCTKVICQRHIHRYLMFRKKGVNIESIRNVLKKNSPKRINAKDYEEYIDIEKFIIKKKDTKKS